MTYQAFNMCPFTIASIGGGASIGGIGSEKYVWTHSPCLGMNCRLWVFKYDDAGEVMAEGCSLQFIGLNNDDIQRNNITKEKIAKENATDYRSDTYCNTCKFAVNKSGLFSDKFICSISNNEVSPTHYCDKHTSLCS